MPITFENIIYDRIVDALNGLLANEFNIPIYLDEHKGNQSFLLTPSADDINEYGNNFQSRDYTIEITYQIKIGGAYTKNSIKQVSNIAERTKRLIYNNASYSPSSSYKWHDGRIESIEYVREDESPDLITAVIIFNCTSTEVT
ncbi:MAG: hypothetical protein Unbinned6747contig1000_45 [Prokaryotic dsDNA virus sp.]|nr:MAG: hypothetical protein Unbinned6747contig1000_45 [Prokaryotic dsDNA virus sp.]|tara:strand:+ start:4088 stop:4516 length:429 start_codon:yes stop_codon:yes gene_type:complete